MLESLCKKGGIKQRIHFGVAGIGRVVGIFFSQSVVNTWKARHYTEEYSNDDNEQFTKSVKKRKH